MDLRYHMYLHIGYGTPITTPPAHRSSWERRYGLCTPATEWWWCRQVAKLSLSTGTLGISESTMQQWNMAVQVWSEPFSVDQRFKSDQSGHHFHVASGIHFDAMNLISSWDHLQHGIPSGMVWNPRCQRLLVFGRGGLRTASVPPYTNVQSIIAWYSHDIPSGYFCYSKRPTPLGSIGRSNRTSLLLCIPFGWLQPGIEWGTIPPADCPRNTAITIGQMANASCCESHLPRDSSGSTELKGSS